MKESFPLCVARLLGLGDLSTVAVSYNIVVLAFDYLLVNTYKSHLERVVQG
jgi:hypothetical protein